MLRPTLALLATLTGACTSDGGSVKDSSSPIDSGSTDTPLPESTDRRVLHEVFTGSTCGPCLPADERISEVVEGDEGRFTMIKYQVGSDPYMTSETVYRIMGYLPGEDTYAIPYMHLDGASGFHPNEMNDDAGYTQEDFDSFADQPASVLLDVTHTISGQTVDFTVDYTVLSDIESEHLVLHAAIIENETAQNIGTNGQTAFHDVMKKMVPDHLGTALPSLVREDSDTLSLSYTFQGSYDEDTSRTDMVDHDTAHTVEEFDDLAVVVWIQDTETWEVSQSAWTKD